MKSRFWMAVPLVFGASACNYTDGQCWPRSQDGPGSGAGGGVVVPGGGGYGDVPPAPQDATEPPPADCLQVPQGPCYEKCLSVYQDNSDKCAGIEDAAQRDICQMAAYTAYKTCRDGCQRQENDCKERCKKQCDKIHDRCHADCKKNDPTSACHDRCNQEYAACLRECDKDCEEK